MERRVTVSAKRYDGTTYRKAEAVVVDSEPGMLHLRVERDTEIWDHKQPYRAPRTYDWYFWPDRWYSIARVYELDGRIQCWYCNIQMLPVISEHSVEYVDLDLDLLVQPDLTSQVLDEDELQEHALTYGYSDDVIARAYQALDEVLEHLSRRLSPFDVQGSTKS